MKNKYKYWINEDGTEHTTTKALYSRWLKDFCTHATTKAGFTIKKPFPAVKHIYCGYNCFGVKICGMMD